MQMLASVCGQHFRSCQLCMCNATFDIARMHVLIYLLEMSYTMVSNIMYISKSFSIAHAAFGYLFARCDFVKRLSIEL